MCWYNNSKQMEVHPTDGILCLLDIPQTTDIVQHDCTLIIVIFYLCHILPNSSFPHICWSTAKLCISEIIDKDSECEIITVALWNVFVGFLVAGIAGLFTVFSSFVFSSSVINFLGSDVSDLKWVESLLSCVVPYNILSSVRYSLQAPWRWRHCILLQCSYLLPRLLGVLTQKTILTVHFELCSCPTEFKLASVESISWVAK